MIIEYKTIDHPEADGRKAIRGEVQYTFSFPLENGMDYLEVRMGKKGRDSFVRMLDAMLQDEEKEK